MRKIQKILISCWSQLRCPSTGSSQSETNLDDPPTTQYLPYYPRLLPLAPPPPQAPAPGSRPRLPLTPPYPHQRNSPTKLGNPTHLRSLMLMECYWTSAPQRDGPIESVPLVSQVVGHLRTWKTALTIFLLFCMKLWHHKGSKLTEPDFQKKILFG